MKNATGRILALAGGLVLVCATWTLGQDWPQWRGANRDGKSATSAPDAWPKEKLTQKWKVPVGTGDASPAVVGDKVYVFARQGDDEVTWCLNVSDGKEVWKDKLAAPAFKGADAKEHAGPRSSPAVADGKVVTLGVHGVVTCLDAAKGTVVWRNEDYKGHTPKFHTSSSPMIVDGLVIVQVGGPSKGSIVALKLADGKAKWTCEGDAPGYASPVLMTVDGVKQVVALTDKSVVGVALADGKQLWQIPFEAKGMAYNAATPIVDGSMVIYSGQGRGTKAAKIEKKGDGFAATEQWANPDVAVKFNSPVLKNGLLFGASDKGAFFCINARDGKTAWVDKVTRGTGYAGFVDAGPVVLGLPENADLVVFKPSDKELSVVAHYKVADMATFGSPVVSGKRLFVQDADSLTLWMVE